LNFYALVKNVIIHKGCKIPSATAMEETREPPEFWLAAAWKVPSPLPSVTPTPVLTPNEQNADSDSFFKLKALYTEAELRRDAHRWETSVERTRKFRPCLNEPTFDIHYNARGSGHKYLDAKPIPYALIVSVRAMQMPDLYDQIFLPYRNSWSLCDLFFMCRFALCEL
jgi:hypothetical protein